MVCYNFQPVWKRCNSLMKVFEFSLQKQMKWRWTRDTCLLTLHMLRVYSDENGRKSPKAAKIKVIKKDKRGGNWRLKFPTQRNASQDGRRKISGKVYVNKFLCLCLSLSIRSSRSYIWRRGAAASGPAFLTGARTGPRRVWFNLTAVHMLETVALRLHVRR